MKTAQRSFAYGEVAPALYSRPDIAMYSQALRKLQNAYIMRAGGVQSRPGTWKVYPTLQFDVGYKPSTAFGPTRLVPCTFSDNESWILEFGNYYVCVLQSGRPLRVGNAEWEDVTQYELGSIIHIGEPGDESSWRAFLCIQAHESDAAVNEPIVGTDWEDYWYEVDVDNFGTAKIVWPTPYTVEEVKSLRFAQTPGIITIVHPNHPPKQLTRVTTSRWTFQGLNFTSPGEVAPPANFTAEIDQTGISAWVTSTSYIFNALVTRSDVVYRCIQAHTSGTLSAPGTGDNWQQYWAIKGTGGNDGGFWYVVTAMDDFGNESNASLPQKLDGSQNPLSPTWESVILSWNEVPGAVAYQVYRALSSTAYQRIAVTANLTFTDINPFSTAYISKDGPPQVPDIFASANNYPSAVSFYQQRLLFAATNNQPDTVWASVTGKPFDFSYQSPLRDDDSVSWRQLSRQAVEIRHLVEIGRRLVAFTNIGEYIITGADDGVLRPGEINPALYSYNGANHLDPIVIDNTALYVQATGSRVLKISPEYQDEPANSDLSILATHLLDGHQIVSWTYQEVPNSLVWMVREDGVLLCLSYVREAGITAWSKCDAKGFYRQVCTVSEIPEYGTTREDVVYAIVEYDGEEVIERIASRNATVTPFLDSSRYVEIMLPVTVVPLPPDATYAYSRIDLQSPYTFTSNDVGAWIQILRDGAAWIAWEISEILQNGSAKIRILLENAPADSEGNYSSSQWVYRSADVEPDPLIVVDDPNAPIPQSMYVSGTSYNTDDNKTSATVNMTGPVFTRLTVGAKLLFKVGDAWDAWVISEYHGPMTVTITHDGEIENFDGIYERNFWNYIPKEVEDYADSDAVIVLDGVQPPPPEPFIGADIVGAKMYTTDSTQQQQGTAQLYYSDDNNTWFPGPTGYITNDELNEWDRQGLGSCGIRSWLGSTPAVLWVDVQPMNEATVGIKSDGTLWAWGTNKLVHQQFQGGPPIQTYFYVFGLGTSIIGSTTPVQVGLDKWRAISAGQWHYAAIRQDGTLWTTGWNEFGQLGQGDLGVNTARSVLTQVGTDTDWAQVFAGPEHTLAIKQNGTLWACGRNNKGQLGTGNTTSTGVFTQIGFGNTWASASAAHYHSMAIATNGTMWACGWQADKGRMGLGNPGIPPYTDILYLTQVGGDSDWKQVDTGSNSTLALKTNGTLWGTGDNWGGQLGLGDNNDRYFFTQVGIENNWKYVDSANEASFGLKNDGTLWSWGWQDDPDGPFGGRLGQGDYLERNTPTQIGSSGAWIRIRAGNSYNTFSVFGIRNSFGTFPVEQGELFVWGGRGVIQDNPQDGIIVYDQLGLDSTQPFSWNVNEPTKPQEVVFPGRRRYWRYVAGEGHPTISRLWLIDRMGNEFFYATYGVDNCGGTGGVPEPGDPGIDIPQTVPEGPWGGKPPWSRLLIGFPYNVDIETLDLDGPQRSLKNDSIRQGEVFVWLNNSGSFYVGPKATDDITQLELYTPTNEEGYPLPDGELYTGVAPVTLRTTYTKNGRIFIRQPDPKPLTVTAIIADGLINGRG